MGSNVGIVAIVMEYLLCNINKNKKWKNNKNMQIEKQEIVLDYYF